MPSIRPRRSALYVPGANLRAIEKAGSLGADVIIFDLEDSVAPAEKEAARARVSAAIGGLHRSVPGAAAPEIVVRVNALDTRWGQGDLAVITAVRPDAILLPKVSGAADLASARKLILQSARLLSQTRMALWAMIETARAVLDPLAIADAQDERLPLECLVLGLNDLGRETRIAELPGRAPMLPFMMNVLAAARAARIDILDGVFNAIDDPAGFAAECDAARQLGFDGKTVIHPSQIAGANTAFSPSDAEIALATKIAGLFDQPENRGLGVVMVEGRMVERLHAEMARRTLKMAEMITERHGRLIAADTDLKRS